MKPSQRAGRVSSSHPTPITKGQRYSVLVSSLIHSDGWGASTEVVDEAFSLARWYPDSREF